MLYRQTSWRQKRQDIPRGSRQRESLNRKHPGVGDSGSCRQEICRIVWKNNRQKCERLAWGSDVRNKWLEVCDLEGSARWQCCWQRGRRCTFLQERREALAVSGWSKQMDHESQAYCGPCMRQTGCSWSNCTVSLGWLRGLCVPSALTVSSPIHTCAQACSHTHTCTRHLG